MTDYSTEYFTVTNVSGEQNSVSLSIPAELNINGEVRLRHIDFVTDENNDIVEDENGEQVLITEDWQTFELTGESHVFQIGFNYQLQFRINNKKFATNIPDETSSLAEPIPDVNVATENEIQDYLDNNPGATNEVIITTLDEIEGKYVSESVTEFDDKYGRTHKVPIHWKGKTLGTNHYSKFEFEKDVELSGNIMSLMYKDGFETVYELVEDNNMAFAHLFEGNATLTSAENLILPAMKLSDGCYEGMFKDCINMTIGPQLPATKLAPNCYMSMFKNCLSLSNKIDLPATYLAQGCYAFMFSGCSNLTNSIVTDFDTVETFAKLSCWMMFALCNRLTQDKIHQAHGHPAPGYDKDTYYGCQSIANI